MNTEVKQEIDVHIIDPKLQSIIDRGYAIRTVKDEMHKKVEKLVTKLKRKFPGHEKEIMSALEGARMEVQSELEKARISPSKPKPAGGGRV